MPSYFIKKKWVHNLVTIYLITFISSCTTPPRSVKPPTSVARAMETRSFEGDLVTILKASINSLQDMDYTIDVLKYEGIEILIFKTLDFDRKSLVRLFRYQK